MLLLATVPFVAWLRCDGYDKVEWDEDYNRFVTAMLMALKNAPLDKGNVSNSSVIMSKWVQRSALNNVLPCVMDDDGLWLEFGVWRGGAMRQIATKRRNGQVIGFDSFRGLPEEWRTGYGETFDRRGRVPFPETKTIKWRVGWFNETLPKFVQANRHRPLRFVHIDCDLYSSTTVIFHELRDRLAPGVWLTFDELFNYPEYRQHEMRALWEMLQERRKVYPTLGVEVVSTSTHGVDLHERPYEAWYKFQAASVRLAA